MDLRVVGIQSGQHRLVLDHGLGSPAVAEQGIGQAQAIGRRGGDVERFLRGAQFAGRIERALHATHDQLALAAAARLGQPDREA